MATKKFKISDNDVQLYLLGELEGEKASYIENISVSHAADLTSKMDKEIKSTLSKIKSVDSMLQNAADNSYSMPADLESKISSILASKTEGQKKTSTSFTEKLKNYFTASNIWSLAGGGAVASICMITVIQIQPDLLIDPRRVADGMSNSSAETQRYRSALTKPSAPIMSVISVPECIEVDREWIVTDKLLIQIPICPSKSISHVEKTVSGFDRASGWYLDQNGTVRLEENFVIKVLPLDDELVSINYREESGKMTVLVENELVKEGKVSQFPDVLSEPFEFGKPLGNDQIIFKTNSGFEYIISFEVK